MTIATHVDPPTLCRECLEVLHGRARGLTNHRLASVCVHQGVFALVLIVDGHICEWDLRGPGLTAEELLQALSLVKHAARQVRIPIQRSPTNWR